MAIAVGHAALSHGIYVYYVNLYYIDKVEDAVTAILATVIDGIKSSQLNRWAASLHAYTLLILDNCDSLLSDEPVRSEFLNHLSELGKFSSKLSLLTTSRYHFTILDTLVETLQVGQLNESASEALLQFMYNQLARPDAKEFAQLAGHNALALKVIGALLREGVPVVDLKKELKQNPIPILSPKYFRSQDQVRACISSSFNRLSNQSQVALVTLAHIPGTFDESDANGILNVNNSSVHESLTRELRRRCLLEFEEKSKRYSFHSLIAAYAKDKNNQHEYIKPLKTERIIIGHYFRKFMDFAVRYDKEPLVVLKLYDLNQQNFQHLFGTLISLNAEFGDPRRVTLTSRSVSQLAIKSDRLIHARMLPSQQKRWYKSALRHSKSVLDAQLERPDENKETACQVLCLLVEAIVKEGNLDITTATREVKRQKQLIRTCTEKDRIRILIAICFVDSSIGDLTEANLECHRKMWEPLSLEMKPIENFFQLGYYYYREGYAQQAYECYNRAKAFQYRVTLAATDKNPIKWSQDVASMLGAYVSMKKAIVGVEMWNDWISRTYELMSDKFEISPEAARNLFLLGSNLHKVSMRILALEVLSQAVKIQIEVLGENHVDTLHSLMAIGQVHFDDGNYTSAFQYFKRSLSISYRIHGPDSRDTVRSLVRIGDSLIHLSRADVDDINYWEKALEIATRNNVRGIDMVQLLFRMSVWHFGKLRPFSSFDYLSRAYHIARGLKEEDLEQPDSPTTRMVQSTSTALQSIDGSVNVRNFVHPFITKYNTYLTQLKDDFSELAWGKTTNHLDIRIVYLCYYGFPFLCCVLCILALRQCMYILLWLFRRFRRYRCR